MNYQPIRIVSSKTIMEIAFEKFVAFKTLMILGIVKTANDNEIKENLL